MGLPPVPPNSEFFPDDHTFRVPPIGLPHGTLVDFSDPGPDLSVRRLIALVAISEWRAQLWYMPSDFFGITRQWLLWRESLDPEIYNPANII